MELKEKVLSYLKDVIKIPRTSGDEREVSNYILSFARHRGLDVKNDESYNLVIKIDGNVPQYKGAPVILQGHMDMVYVKEPDSTHRYDTGISTVTRDGCLYAADGTSLGADNGVALSYCMAIMDSPEIPHPPLEIILTVGEEVGLVGASRIDCYSLKSKYLINLDSEKEGEILTSCAGGIREYFDIPTGEQKPQTLVPVKIAVKGLIGGHSGTDIDLGRGNAIKLLARLLKEIDCEDIHLSSFNCTGKANAIPTAAYAVLGIPADILDFFREKIEGIRDIFKNEYAATDNIDVTISRNTIEKKVFCYSDEEKETIYDALTLLPFGVISKSFILPNLTETSVNIGSADELTDVIKILCSVRSSVASKKYAVVDQIDTVAKLTGCKSITFNDYPQWIYKEKSPLRDLALTTYKDMFHKDGVTASIHGGLECGYFDTKMRDIDMISLGCDLYAVHTPKEHVSIESLYNVWDMLLEILKRISQNELLK